MADEIGKLLVRIDAEDNASAVLARVSGSINGLEGAGASGAKSVKTLSDEMKRGGVTAEKYASGLDAVEAAEKSASKASSAKRWEETGKSLKELGDGLDSVTKPFQYAAVGAIAGGVAVSKAAMDYETAFTGVRKTLDGTPEQLDAVNSELRQMAKEIPVSAAGLADIAAIGGQLGVGAEDITKFTKTIAAMNVSTDLAGEEGAAALARIQTVTGDTMDNVDRTASAIVDLGNKTAATESEIAYMAVRMGKYGNTVGMSTADVLGYSAALSSMGIEAQLGGSAIGRTWLDIETAVGAGGEALEAYAKYAGTSAEEFAKQWSADPSGAFNGFIKGLSATENLTQAMNELGIVNTQDQQVIMALANGYDFMTDCLNTSSAAYAENTALTNEANAAYGTTANQLKLAKNAVVDAAISWGDVLLPEIRSGAQWVGSLAEGFGNLNDGTKRAVISGAKTAVVIGGISKATVGAVKGIGGFVEGLGQIKTAMSAGGALAKFAPTLTAIGSAAGPVALAIGGITAAVVVGKKAYDAYQESELNAARRMADTSTELVAATEQYKELNDLQWEYNNLQGKISSGKLDGADLEQAKARLEEIKQILSENYKINVDSGDIDQAIEKAKQLSRLEVVQQRASLVNDLSGYEDGAYGNLQRQIESDTKLLSGYTDQMTSNIEAQAAITDLRTEWAGLTAEQQNSLEIQKDFGQRLNDAAHAGGLPEDWKYDYNEFGIALLDLGSSYIDLEDKADAANKAITESSEKAELLRTAGENIATVGLAEISMGETEKGFDDIRLAIDKAGLSASNYATEIAKIQTGDADLGALWEKGGADLDNFVSKYISNMQQLDAAERETAVGASLLKNGFTELSQVPTDTLPLIEQQATSILQTMDGMQGKSIKIDVDSGTVQVLNDTTKAVEEISGKDVSVSVTADGDVSVLDEATGKMEELGVKGAVNLRVNADGNIEVLDEAGAKIAEIDGTTGEVIFLADTSDVDGYTPENKEGFVDYKTGDVEKPDNPTSQGTINWITGTSPTTVPPASGQANFSLGSHPTAAPNIPGTANYSGVFPDSAPTITGTVIYNAIYNNGSGTKNMFAKGTQNFPGGLAMVNDQKGIPDPRELIIDNGRAFIPQGRDVILPLTKGAKVYTARQTKRIMRNIGIPHYAEGKSNSDAFTAASDDWTHYIKTHAVTVTQELEKWNELAKKFTENVKDVEDIEENIYSLIREQREELNEQSEDYISERNFLNDWDAFGDSAVAAFDRVRDREYAYVADSKITEKEAADYLAELGKSMYDERIENSEAWIDKQIRYNDMSVEDTKAAYDRMAAYTQEYYDNGLISYREYIEGLNEIDEQRAESLYDAYSAKDNDAQRYKQLAEVFGFDEGDTLVKTIGRELDNLNKAYADGAFAGRDDDYWDKRADLLAEQAQAVQAEYDAEWDEWQRNMDKERTLYDTWDLWDSVGGKTGWLEDYARRLQQFRDEEKISEEEFRQEMLDVYVEYYGEQEKALDDVFQSYSDYIDSVNERYDNLISKKEEAFDMQSLNDDIAEQQRKAEIYEGAVTQRGQDVYNDAVDRLEELQHQKEIKELQQEQTKVVSGLRDDLEAAEKYKKQILNSADAHLIDINAIAQSINSGTTDTQDILRALLSAVKNINGGVIYGDTNYNITGADTSLLAAFERRGARAISGF